MKLSELPYKQIVIKGDQIVNEYERALEWLNTLGFQYSKNRFGAYHKSIKNSLKEITKEKNFDKKLKAINEYLNSYFEAFELIRLRNAFNTKKHEEYIEQMKFVISGQPFRNIAKNDHSRNYSFELTLAARLINAGYATYVDQIADIVSEIEGRTVYFECKRVKSINNLKKNVSSANEQLKKRMQNSKSTGAKGISALNITDVLNPQSEFIFTSSCGNLKRTHSNEMNEFMRSREKELRTKASKNILGIICEYLQCGLIIKDKLFDINICRGIKFLQYDDSYSSDKFTNEILKKISNPGI